DVAEAIHLEELRTILGASRAARSPSFAHPTPDYVRFEQPPVIDPLEPIELDGGERLEGKAKYYDYGVVSVELELRFECDWETLVNRSSAWMSAPGIERRAGELVRRALKRTATALVKAYDFWLTEDYYIIELDQFPGPEGGITTATELLA